MAFARGKSRAKVFLCLKANKKAHMLWAAETNLKGISLEENKGEIKNKKGFWAKTYLSKRVF